MKKYYQVKLYHRYIKKKQKNLANNNHGYNLFGEWRGIGVLHWPEMTIRKRSNPMTRNFTSQSDFWQPTMHVSFWNWFQSPGTVDIASRFDRARAKFGLVVNRVYWSEIWSPKGKKKNNINKCKGARIKMIKWYTYKKGNNNPIATNTQGSIFFLLLLLLLLVLLPLVVIKMQIQANRIWRRKKKQNAFMAYRLLY